MTSLHASSSPVVLTFWDEVSNGPILDPRGTIVYTLRSKRRAFRSDTTSISTAERVVATIKWDGGIFSSEPTIEIPGAKTRRSAHRLKTRQHRESNGSTIAEFRDESGNALYWRNRACFDASDNVLIATQRRRREFNLNINRPSSLLVRRDYCSHPCLLYILASAIIMEKKDQLLSTRYLSARSRESQDSVQVHEDAFVAVIAPS